MRESFIILGFILIILFSSCKKYVLPDGDSFNSDKALAGTINGKWVIQHYWAAGVDSAPFLNSKIGIKGNLFIEYDKFLIFQWGGNFFEYGFAKFSDDSFLYLSPRNTNIKDTIPALLRLESNIFFYGIFIDKIRKAKQRSLIFSTPKYQNSRIDSIELIKIQ